MDEFDDYGKLDFALADWHGQHAVLICLLC